MNTISRKIAVLLVVVMMLTAIITSSTISNSASTTVELSKSSISIDGNISDWANVPVRKITTDLAGKLLVRPWTIQIAWNGTDSIYVLAIMEHNATYTSTRNDPTGTSNNNIFRENILELFVAESDEEASFKNRAKHYVWNINTHFELAPSGTTPSLTRPDEYKIIPFGSPVLSSPTAWGVEARIKLTELMVDKLKTNEGIYFNAGNQTYMPPWNRNTVYEQSLMSNGTKSDLLFWDATALSLLQIAPEVPNVTKVKVVRNKKSKTSAKLTWKNLAKDKATGYKIYRATKKKGKYKLIKTIKKVNTKSFISKGLGKKKTYYYKIVAYKNTNGKDYLGKDSKIVKINMKTAKNQKK